MHPQKMQKTASFAGAALDPKSVQTELMIIVSHFSPFVNMFCVFIFGLFSHTFRFWRKKNTSGFSESVRHGVKVVDRQLKMFGKAVHTESVRAVAVHELQV